MIVTQPFVAVTRTTAAVLGLPAYPFAVVAHPISRLQRAELRSLAALIAPLVVELLTA